MIYFESPYAKISWNEQAKAVFVEFKGFAQGEAIREIHEKGLELLVQKKASKWLSDNRKLSAINQDDQNWVAQDFYPSALAGGMKFLATVTPEKAIARSSLNRTLSSVKAVAESPIETFGSVEEAIEWLAGIN